MNEKVKAEACQLYIKQEIEDGLKQGKEPADIGREVHDWVVRVFEADIKARSVEQRARREKAKQEQEQNVTSVTTEKPTPRTLLDQQKTFRVKILKRLQNGEPADILLAEIDTRITMFSGCLEELGAVRTEIAAHSAGCA